MTARGIPRNVVDDAPDEGTRDFQNTSRFSQSASAIMLVRSKKGKGCSYYLSRVKFPVMAEFARDKD